MCADSASSSASSWCATGETLEPAAAEASRVIDEMKARGFLLSTDGPLHNVLKIKPPMVIQAHDVDEMLEALDEVLSVLA